MIPRSRRGTWVGGTALAFGGVLVARLGADLAPAPWPPWVRTAGILLAFAGLFVITLGTRTRRDPS
ncbi:MAG: hypothetical protein IPJ17_11720 [Holophagales bacterium]|nr:MAG: hypothetical protein IPJ17_11720 [Holophagales bacterium]